VRACWLGHVVLLVAHVLAFANRYMHCMVSLVLVGRQDITEQVSQQPALALLSSRHFHVAIRGSWAVHAWLGSLVLLGGQNHSQSS
jgi:hypothetical protein